MNKKKIVIILLGTLVLIIIVSLIIFSLKSDKVAKINSESNSVVVEKFTPDFLTVEEKTKLDIPVDKKIQAITRDQEGVITVYKIINNETDITDPSQIK